MRERVAGIETDRLLQELDALSERVRTSPVPEMAALEEGLVRGRIDRAAPRQARSLLWGQLHLNFVGDGASDVALQRQDIAQVALVLLGPQVRIRRRVNQLRGDSNAAVRSQHRALDDGIDVERLRDLGQRLSSALVAHHRGARDHAQRANLGEGRDERVGHAVREEFLVGPWGEVLEREHRERANAGVL